MAEPRSGPSVYAIAAHRGFADALVAGLAPRYANSDVGLANLTLLLPSSRARRTVGEAFVRHMGEGGGVGMLMPRLAVVGDLDLDEALGALLDPLGVPDIRPAVDPRRRWFALAQLIAHEMGDRAPAGTTLLRLARETAATMDRLLAEDIAPEDLVDEKVVGIFPDLSAHWQESLRLFAAVQRKWLAQLESWGMTDAATRRNRLFDHAASAWRARPPATPIVAAGVTGAAPALARLLRVIADLPQGAVILPDFDLTMAADVWDELGRAGDRPGPDDTPFGREDAVTHPQYHLKLLLNRMGVAREEVQPWHRRGLSAAPPERSHAIGALFLPPEASKAWVGLPPEKRRFAGVRIMEAATPEEEAQAIALLAREALEVPGKRVAVVTPDRALARRVVNHLARWNVLADDSAGRSLSQTATARALLLLAEVMAEDAAPVPLMALLAHPLVDGGIERTLWLGRVRMIERELRGPRAASGLAPVRGIVENLAEKNPDVAVWWAGVEQVLSPLLALGEQPQAPLSEQLDLLVAASEALCGDKLWAREDGRALAQFVDELRLHAHAAEFALSPRELATMLTEAMEEVAVRPPYGGHSRIQILGLLEARMNRADLVICAGLNEGSWPARGTVDALLAPPVLRALGVPGADFRIGLSAHDLAGALGAPEVVLSRAGRDESGPAIPSRFLLRIQALLLDRRSEYDLSAQHRETRALDLARALTWAERAPPASRPQPTPTHQQRAVPISATALDRLRGDPFQFYAGSILRLADLDGLDADPSPAWQGSVAHTILERWHLARRSDPTTPIAPVMRDVLDEMNAHPLMRGLWVPRLQAALEWIADSVGEYQGRSVAAVEAWGEMTIDGVLIRGRADRIDTLPGGELAIVDYKTGGPPSRAMVEQGFALQLGVLGMMAERGGFEGLSGHASVFEYWSLGRSDDKDNPHGFGYVQSPLKLTERQKGIPPEDFLPVTEDFLREAIAEYINGSRPFTARLNPDYPTYDTYDHLMRLDEWLPRIDQQTELEP